MLRVIRLRALWLGGTVGLMSGTSAAARGASALWHLGFEPGPNSPIPVGQAPREMRRVAWTRAMPWTSWSRTP